MGPPPPSPNITHLSVCPFGRHGPFVPAALALSTRQGAITIRSHVTTTATVVWMLLLLLYKHGL